MEGKKCGRLFLTTSLLHFIYLSLLFSPLFGVGA